MNNPAEFHSDHVGNDGALGIFEEVDPTRKRRRTTTAITI